jgi:hypothetical protein
MNEPIQQWSMGSLFFGHTASPLAGASICFLLQSNKKQPTRFPDGCFAQLK